MSQKRYTIWATKQTRYNGERVLPGTKIENVTEDEMPGIISSGRFTLNEDEAPKLSKPETAAEKKAREAAEKEAEKSAQ